MYNKLFAYPERFHRYISAPQTALAQPMPEPSKSDDHLRIKDEEVVKDALKSFSIEGKTDAEIMAKVSETVSEKIAEIEVPEVMSEQNWNKTKEQLSAEMEAQVKGEL